MPEPARIDSSPPSQEASLESEPRVHLESGSRISLTAANVAAKGADYNLRIVWPLARYIEDKHGLETLERIAKRNGLEAEWLDGRTQWVSIKAFEGFLRSVHELVVTEAEFKEACVYRLPEAYGALRFLLWAMSPSAVYDQAVKTIGVLSTVDRLETVDIGKTTFHMRALSNGAPVARETCLARQAQCAALPTLWGLPRAHVHEEKCLAFGDATCELHFSWYAHNRVVPVLGAALVGGAIGVVLHLLGHSWPLAFTCLVIGTLAGYIAEARSAVQANETTRARVMKAITQLGHEETEARREIMALNDRQREWERALEAAHSERVEAMQGVLKRAEAMQQQRETTLLGFSHDLRNPLMVLASTVEFLRDNGDSLGDEGPEIIADVEASIEQMKRMLGDFVAVATDQELVKLSPKRLETPVLTASLTRRLRALVQGRPIVPSVMQTRDAPEAIMLDPIVFDRVTDNLLTNASKYTERGSIVVEVSGSPSSVVVKISDSGRGIAEEDLVRIFTAGGSHKAGRARDSYGVGLSVILQLLDQVGGLLEVQSAPGKGTTFWAHFPTHLEASGSDAKIAIDSNQQIVVGEPLSSRVRIRKQPA